MQSTQRAAHTKPIYTNYRTSSLKRHGYIKNNYLQSLMDQRVEAAEMFLSRCVCGWFGNHYVELIHRGGSVTVALSIKALV